MENLRICTNEEFGEVNVIVINNKEYFEATQVARILGYSNPRDAIIRHCRKEGVIFSDVGVVTGVRSDGYNSIQYVNKKFIDEGNVYRLIIKSKLPSAKRFEGWLVDEVLPSIRKNGAYIDENIVEKALNDPDLIIQMATIIKLEREQRINQMLRADNLESIIAYDTPYTRFAKNIESCRDSISIGQFAKLLNNNNIKIGRNRLYSWFRENGYLIKCGRDKNTPKQTYLEQGLFSICEKLVDTPEGEILTTRTLITGKGQLYFENLINSYYEDKVYCEDKVYY